MTAISPYEFLPLNIRRKSAAAIFDQSVIQAGYSRHLRSPNIVGRLNPPKNQKFGFQREDSESEDNKTSETLEELLHIGSYLRDKDMEQEVSTIFPLDALSVQSITSITERTRIIQKGSGIPCINI